MLASAMKRAFCSGVLVPVLTMASICAACLTGCAPTLQPCSGTSSTSTPNFRRQHADVRPVVVRAEGAAKLIHELVGECMPSEVVRAGRPGGPGHLEHERDEIWVRAAEPSPERLYLGGRLRRRGSQPLGGKAMTICSALSGIAALHATSDGITTTLPGSDT